MRNWLRPSSPATAPALGVVPESGPLLRDAICSADPVGWVVIDFETTGFMVPSNRVVEIGAVHVDRDGSVGASWGTLINPGRDVGPTRIHGIHASDVRDAPTFADAASDFLEFIEGRLVAGHNVSFDAWFLRHELRLLGLDATELGYVDTRPIALELGLGSRLADVAESLQVDEGSLHAAENDALVTAVVLSLGVEAWGADEVLAQAHGWGVIDSALCELPRRPCQARRREEFTARPASSHVLLDEIGSLPSAPHHELGIAGAEWLAMLERALEDRLLDDQELDALRAHAARSGLTIEEITRISEQFFAATLRHALADGVIADDERRDLGRLAAVIGLDADAPITHVPGAAVENPVSACVGALADGGVSAKQGALATDGGGGAAAAGGGGAGSAAAGGLRAGDRICFTGELAREIDGYQVSRATATRMAEDCGLIVAGNVSRKLTALICADPDSMSGKARRARELGVRIIDEHAFWRYLDAMR